MIKESSEAPAKLDSVRIDAEGIAEIDRDRRVIFVPREEITRLEIGCGSGAENPLLLLILGGFCIALAVVLMATFVLVLIKGGVRMPAALITGFTFVIPGWWFLDLALRRRWFIRVHTTSKCRKVVSRTEQPA